MSDFLQSSFFNEQCHSLDFCAGNIKRGCVQTTWTEFWAFWPPPPTYVDTFTVIKCCGHLNNPLVCPRGFYTPNFNLRTLYVTWIFAKTFCTNFESIETFVLYKFENGLYLFFWGSARSKEISRSIHLSVKYWNFFCPHIIFRCMF